MKRKKDRSLDQDTLELHRLTHEASSVAFSPETKPHNPEGASLGQLFLAGGLAVKGDIHTFLGRLVESPQVRSEEAKLLQAQATRRTRRPRRLKGQPPGAPPQPLPAPCPHVDIAALEHTLTTANASPSNVDDLHSSSSSFSSPQLASTYATALTVLPAAAPSSAAPWTKCPPHELLRHDRATPVDRGPGGEGAARGQIKKRRASDAPLSALRHEESRINTTCSSPPRSASTPDFGGEVFSPQTFMQAPPLRGPLMAGLSSHTVSDNKQNHQLLQRWLAETEPVPSGSPAALLDESSSLDVSQLIYDIGDYCLSLCSDACANATLHPARWEGDHLLSGDTYAASSQRWYALDGHDQPDRMQSEQPPSFFQRHTTTTRDPKESHKCDTSIPSSTSGRSYCRSLPVCSTLGVSVPSPPTFQIPPKDTDHSGDRIQHPLLAFAAATFRRGNEEAHIPMDSASNPDHSPQTARVRLERRSSWLSCSNEPNGARAAAGLCIIQDFLEEQSGQQKGSKESQVDWSGLLYHPHVPLD